MGLVTRHIPDVSHEEMLGALKAAMAEANRFGVTAVSDIPGSSSSELRGFDGLAQDAVLTVRWSLYPRFSSIETSRPAIRAFKGKEGWMAIRGFKAVMDGSLGSRTAYMREPFADNPESQKAWRGQPLPNMVDGPFEANCRAAMSFSPSQRSPGSQPGQQSLQAICHAIGDEANHQLLNILERAYGAGLREARCRSEHAQHLLPADIPRFGALGVIASMQPYHKADDARYCEQRIGPERSKSSYAFKSLLDSGAVVAFGSDWPVVSINPFLGIEAAVTGRILPTASGPNQPELTRTTPNAPQTWMTQENITVAEALRCYTSRAAYAMFMEHEIGKVAPGFRADFIVLNASPFAPNPNWSAIKPVEVWVEGRRVLLQVR
jgi:predicted amidohydrolase YtcJ